MKQWVAPRLPAKRRCQLGVMAPRAPAREAGEQRERLLVGERRQVDRDESRVAPEPGQHAGQRSARRGVRGPVGQNDQAAELAAAGEQVVEHQQGGVVGPVQVLQHEDERRVVGDQAEQRQGRLEEGELLRGGRVLAGRRLPEALGGLRHQPAQLGQLAARSRQHRGRDVLETASEGLDERKVRFRQLGAGAAEQNGRALRVSPGGELGDQPCLADPGLSGDDREAPAVLGVGQRLAQKLELCHAPAQRPVPAAAVELAGKR